MTTHATAAALAHDADPQPDRPTEAAPAPSPGRFRQLLGLVRKLIDYGRELVSTLQQDIPVADHFPIRLQFGTVDMALILRRITNGLRRAAALEYRLIDCTDREATAKPATHATAPPPQPKPRAVRTKPPRAEADPRLADLPTAEEIAAQVRRRPIGAVLADICEDLGILPTHPLWQELHLAVTFNGGSFPAMAGKVATRLSAATWPEPDAVMRQPMPPGLPALATLFGVEPATGPP